MARHAVDRLYASVRAHPAWSSLTFTVVLCTLVAALLSLARGGTLESEILVMSYSIGLSIHVCMYVGFVWWSPRLPQPVVSIAMLGCGLVLGMAVGGTLTEGRPLLLLGNGQALAIGAVLGALTIGGSCVMESWWDARARLARAERDALARDKALAEAELRVLQAQVEPHFLFNTLANVVSLIHTHPDRAARLLERLTSLLRASLSRTRRADGTLGDELAVVRAYLDIQAERMAGRMTYRVDVDPGPRIGADAAAAAAAAGGERGAARHRAVGGGRTRRGARGTVGRRRAHGRRGRRARHRLGHRRARGRHRQRPRAPARRVRRARPAGALGDAGGRRPTPSIRRTLHVARHGRRAGAAGRVMTSGIHSAKLWQCGTSTGILPRTPS